MRIKIILFISFLSTQNILSQIIKCSDAPLNACGSNSNCFDDQTDINYKKFNGPYCKCSNDSYGSPPNCQPHCSYDSDCKANEFCDYSGSKECIEGCRTFSCDFGQHCDFTTRTCTNGCKMDLNCGSNEFCDKKSQKCEKICDLNSCGSNGKCLATYHTKYCSCEDGYIPDSDLEGCRKEKYSKEKANCENSCKYPSKCSEIEESIYCYCPNTPESNPMQSCPPSISYFPGQPQPFKPTTESQVFSLQTVMILTG